MVKGKLGRLGPPNLLTDNDCSLAHNRRTTQERMSFPYEKNTAIDTICVSMYVCFTKSGVLLYHHLKASVLVESLKACNSGIKFPHKRDRLVTFFSTKKS